jgi:integrase
MPTIKYFTKGKQEEVNIYINLIDGRDIQLKCPTGYSINPKFWSTAKGEPKQSAHNPEKLNLSDKLNEMKNFIYDKLKKDKSLNEINSQWLKDAISHFKNPLLSAKNDFLIDALINYQNTLRTKINKRTGRLTSGDTLRNFNTTISRIKKFEEYKTKNKNNPFRFNISDIDLSFHDTYVKFAIEQLKLSTNSYGKDLRQIKTVCLDARDRGLTINRQIESRKFNAPSEPTTFVTITESEIQLIKGFTGADYLENARDWLIIGCWTGCRVGDLMSLNNDNILSTTTGQKFIRYTQSKTGKIVDLPIHPDVKEIIDRLNGFPRPISDQRFNDWIKKVCREVGITQIVQGTRQNPNTHKKEVGTFEKWQLIRSHTCRRSFATNHYNKLPNKLIMAVTGHATERMLLNYLGETENTHLMDFLNVWNTSTPVPENKTVKLKIS